MLHDQLSLHKDLQIKNVTDFTKIRYKRIYTKPNLSTNTLIKNMATLYVPDKPSRRLKRNWNRELLIYYLSDLKPNLMSSG